MVCHVILKDHKTNGSSNFMGVSYSKQVSILASLVAIDTMVVEI